MLKNIGASIRLQKDVKDNALEVEDFITDLRKWEKNVKEKENHGGVGQNGMAQDLPPVRCRKSDGSTGKIITDNRGKKDNETTKEKKERISSYDYAAWERFDVDKALESSDDDEDYLEGNSEPQNIKKITEVQNKKKSPELQDIKKNTSSSYKTLTPNQKERAIKLKDEGNQHYSNNRLEDAIAKYTQGIALDPTNPILPANRAMAYIKLEKYEAAELDCSKCLKLDSNYIKAFLRRGTSRLKLGKTQLAAEDFRKVLQLEPWNKDAKRELENIDKQTIGSCNTEKSDKGKMSPPDLETVDVISQKIKDIDKAQTTKPAETKQKSGKKKITVTEVDSSADTSYISLSKDSEAVTPIVKLPHHRSQKPMKKIKVMDVTSEDTLPKALPSSAESKEIKPKVVPKSNTSNIHFAKNSQEQDSEAIKNAHNKIEMPAIAVSSVPPVPRTSYQFTQDWQRLSKHQPHAVSYIKAIKPSFFQDIDMDTEVLLDFVSALRWDDFNPEEIASYLSALAKSDGFSVNLMFLSDKQKEVFFEVIDRCKSQERLHRELLSKFKTAMT